MFRTILSSTLWPLTIAAGVGSLLLFSNLHDAASLYAVISITVLASLVGLLAFELVVPYRQDWRLYGDRDLLRDIGHYILYGLIGSTVAQSVFVVALAGALAPLNLPSLWPTNTPFVVQILLVVVLGDFLEYWLHRLAHSIPALWRVHAVHHMPMRLHALKAARHHVLYFLLRGLIVWTPLLLIGVPSALIVWQVAALSVTGNLAHANIDFKIPKVMHKVLVTPEIHRLHHSIDHALGNSNFGALLPVWDMLFGTYTDPVTTPLAAVGIEGDPIPHRWLVELGWPLFFKRLPPRLASEPVER
jgi:sterol desaturase/sphingolipid hydroxylase (fatty acid hydroxylase superfamily)